MKQDPEQESQLRRYLLGELRLEEQVLIEQRLFLDRDYAELAQGVEDDLIDDYVHDDLTPVERQEFETHFLSIPQDLHTSDTILCVDPDVAAELRSGSCQRSHGKLIESVFLGQLPHALADSDDVGFSFDPNFPDIDLGARDAERGLCFHADSYWIPAALNRLD